VGFACGLPAGGGPWLAVDGFAPGHRCPGRLLGSVSAFEKSPRGNVPLGDEVLVPVGVHCRTRDTGYDWTARPAKAHGRCGHCGLGGLEEGAGNGHPGDAAAVGRPRSASGAGAGGAGSGVDGEAPPRDHGRALLRAWGLLPERGTATFLNVALAPAISVREPQE
jgi:hypothetical protein